MFFSFKHMVCRGPRSEDFGLADVEVEVVIFFENGCQDGYEVQDCRKFHDDIDIVGGS